MINQQRATFLGLLFILTFQSQAQFTILTDLSPGTSDSAKISKDFALANGELFFTAIQPEYGRELWKTDANSGGASLVRDIKPGSSGTEYKSLISFNDKVFFFAQDHLWISEGTEESTFVIDSTTYGVKLVEFQNELFYNDRYYRLSKTNGEVDGSTFLFSNPTHDSYGTMPIYVSDKIYFVSFNPEVRQELYVSDGTVEGTHLLKDINTSTTNYGHAIRFLAHGNFGHFFSSDPIAQTESVYFTRGTEESTVQLTNFLVSPNNATELGDNAIFLRNNTIYQSNGTKEGTMVTGNFEHTLKNFPAETLGDQVFFSLESPNEGEELWVTDGTTAGTRLIKDIIPGSESSSPSNPVVVDDLLFFVAGDSTNGFNIYYTDGSSENTVQFSDQFKFIRHLKVLDGDLYFIATDEANGEELWKADLSNLDLSRPKINLNTSITNYTDQSPVNLTIISSEILYNLEASDFKIINGRAENLAGSGNIYTIDIIPEYDSLVYVELPANATTDSAGNGNQRAIVSFRFDENNPSAEIICQQGDTTRLSPLTFELSFDEQLMNLDSTALIISNGSLLSFAQDGDKYIFDVEHNILDSGYVQILLRGDSVIDKVGKSMETDLLDSIFIDRIKPTMKLFYNDLEINEEFYITNDTFKVKYIASEPVLGVSPDALYSNDKFLTPIVIDFDTISVTEYEVTYKIPEWEFDEYSTDKIGIYCKYVYDLFGNRWGNGVLRRVIRIDISKPKLTFKLDQQISNNPLTNATLTFSETPYGFDIEDLIIENGIISEFTGADKNYSLKISAESEGDVRLYVNDSAFVDKANLFNDLTEVIFKYDTTRPKIEFQSIDYSNQFVEDSIIFLFNEPIRLNKPTEIHIENGIITRTELLSNSMFRLSVNPDSEGDVIISVTDSAFIDMAGNPLASTQITSYVYDITAPYLINDSSFFTSNANPVSVELQFSEPVIGLSDSSFSFDNLNYTITDFSSADSSCTFNISLDEAGFLEMSSIKGIITDRAGNELNQLFGTILLDDVAPSDFTIRFEQGQYALRDGVTVSILIENPELNSVYEYNLGSNNLLSIQGTDTIRTIENDQFVLKNILVDDLNAGQMNLEVTLTDSLGNISDVKTATSELIIILGNEGQRLVTAYTESQTLHLKFLDQTFEDAMIRISELSGKELIKLKNDGSKEQVFQLSNSGVYLVQLVTDKQQESFKILIR